MDPQTVFCPNSACPASGQMGKGNTHVHSHKEQRYICDVCGHTFAATKGTVFYKASSGSLYLRVSGDVLPCGHGMVFTSLRSVKPYARQRVVGVSCRVVQGTPAEIEARLHQTQGGGVINTAYIERLNATFRARITPLVRRGRALAGQVSTLHQAMYLMGTVYNFCTYHKSLRVPVYLPRGQRRWLHRTPAIAAGITDHLWSVEELLWFRVPPPRWRPPTRRGRPSNAMKALVAQWCT